MSRTTGAKAATGTVRMVIARCTVEYQGRLGTYLPEAARLLLFKGDGSISIHSEFG